MEVFCSGLHLPNDILLAKTVLQRLLRWKWFLHANWCKIIQNHQNKVRRLLHLLQLSDSQPSSVHNFSRDVPVIARAAEYGTDFNFSIRLGKVTLLLKPQTFAGIW